MICPKCQKETPSIIRECQFCKTDLEVHRSIRSRDMEDPEWDKKASRLIDFGPTAGIVMMVIAVIWFVVGLMDNIIFYYPVVLFVTGIGAIIIGLRRK